ncbi:prohead protease/major capsid protein fusion protein [Seohaeicola nanhaiensis]|uniref:Prohead protease/major capsid protein fusion protein n=1 Tax=Seohaeicola nanhaiensis TaxID=1387282 RepID=A0ABV9KAA6_9RHOB
MPLDDTWTRAATTRPNSFDPQTRTVSAVIATSNPVQRSDARGPFAEVLTADTLDLSASQGVAVLDSHNTSSVRHQLGRVRSIGLEGGSVVAVLELTSAEDAAPVLQRIADGTVSGVSIGYRVTGWTETNSPSGRVKTPTGWRISEVTLTSSPADPSARLRHQEESVMPETLETQTPEALETQRRADIRGLVRAAGLAPDVADQLIDQRADMTAAKATVFDALEDRRRSAPVIRTHAPQNDDPSVIRQRREEALHIRMAGGEPKPEVRQFMGESFLDMARDSLTRSGVSTRGLTPDEVFTRAAEHTTSDFPTLVSNAMNKTALASYLAAASPLKRLGRQRSLSNFKSATSIRLGEMGRLEELTESGEITATSRAENGETMNLKTYARSLNVSRTLLINDDLNLLGDMTAAFGEAAAQTEADIMVDLITSNPDLSDGTPVFDASRGNLAGTGVALGDAGVQDALDAARKSMRTVKGLDGQTIINVSPKLLLVGPDSESDAERLLASIYPATTDDVNVYATKLSLLVEPRLEGPSWYIFSDPNRLAALQYGYLSSAQGVQIQRSEAWNTLGMRFRAWLDFGAGWLDWRAAYLNEGA